MTASITSIAGFRESYPDVRFNLIHLKRKDLSVTERAFVEFVLSKA